MGKKFRNNEKSILTVTGSGLFFTERDSEKNKLMLEQQT